MEVWLEQLKLYLSKNVPPSNLGVTTFEKYEGEIENPENNKNMSGNSMVFRECDHLIHYFFGTKPLQAETSMIHISTSVAYSLSTLYRNLKALLLCIPNRNQIRKILDKSMTDLNKSVLQLISQMIHLQQSQNNNATSNTLQPESFINKNLITDNSYKLKTPLLQCVLNSKTIFNLISDNASWLVSFVEMKVLRGFLCVFYGVLSELGVALKTMELLSSRSNKNILNVISPSQTDTPTQNTNENNGASTINTTSATTTIAVSKLENFSTTSYNGEKLKSVLESLDTESSLTKNSKKNLTIEEEEKNITIINTNIKENEEKLFNVKNNVNSNYNNVLLNENTIEEDTSKQSIEMSTPAPTTPTKKQEEKNLKNEIGTPITTTTTTYVGEELNQELKLLVNKNIKLITVGNSCINLFKYLIKEKIIKFLSNLLVKDNFKKTEVVLKFLLYMEEVDKIYLEFETCLKFCLDSIEKNLAENKKENGLEEEENEKKKSIFFSFNQKNNLDLKLNAKNFIQ
ncbi:hypothetical protein HK099_002402, partial [Clydaea vesicula]